MARIISGRKDNDGPLAASKNKTKISRILKFNITYLQYINDAIGIEIYTSSLEGKTVEEIH